MSTQIKIWGFGGAGCSLMQEMVKLKDRLGKEVSFAMVDKSDSNVSDDIRDVPFYMIGGREGTGQIRSEAFEALDQNAKEAISSLKPGIFNILVFSLSGGSGSMIGPQFIREFMDRSLPFVCFVVGSTMSQRYTSNTVSSLKTLVNFARVGKTPVPISYYENSTQDNNSGLVTGSIPTVNKALINNLSLLCEVLRKNTRNLDNSDKTNLLNYSKALTDISPSLCMMHITDNPGHRSELNQLAHLTTCSLAPFDGDSSSFLENSGLFSIEGYASEPDVTSPVYVCTESQSVASLMKGLLEEEKSWNEQASKMEEHTFSLEDETDDGWVF